MNVGKLGDHVRGLVLAASVAGGLVALTLISALFLYDKVSSILEMHGFLQKQQVLLSREQLQEEARAITVKVFSGNFWGSGVLICQAGQSYTVLTAEHVLDIGEAYRVETPDGQVYPAYRLEFVRIDDRDIALLRFQGGQNPFQTAVLGDAITLAVGNPVYAAGFSFESDPSLSTDFTLTDGQILLLPDQPFQNGYQIGYTNRVEQGMSGGPLLNAQGYVIGMNGMDKYPLWANPYVFQDGSVPSASAREQMRRLSWAIPAQAILHFPPLNSTSTIVSNNRLLCSPEVERIN